MSYFDRFDICEAYAVLEWDWNVGGWLRERPSNARRMESTSVQLSRMGFRARPNLSFDTLSENAQEIYRDAEVRFGLRKDVCSVCSEPVAADTYVHAWPDGGGMHRVVRRNNG